MLGARSVLLQEGAERMRRYGELMDAITLGDMATWPVGEAFPLMPRSRR